MPPLYLGEHAPNTPNDGAWFQKNVIETVVNRAAYNETTIFITYDGDMFHSFSLAKHLTSIRAGRMGRPCYSISLRKWHGEWLQDPDSDFGYTFAGPGKSS
jgi:phospholipase C